MNRSGPPQAASDTTNTTASVAIAAQIRRRREASNRLPVLADHRRDPLDTRKPRPTILVWTIGTRNTTAMFSGNNTAVAKALRTIGCARQRARGSDSWQCPATYLDQVVELLMARGHRVEEVLPQ